MFPFRFRYKSLNNIQHRNTPKISKLIPSTKKGINKSILIISLTLFLISRKWKLGYIKLSNDEVNPTIALEPKGLTREESLIEYLNLPTTTLVDKINLIRKYIQAHGELSGTNIPINDLSPKGVLEYFINRLLTQQQ
jgi:hypothetical protein